MNDVLIQKPPRTILEVFESLPEGTLCQVINNTLTMSPAPVDSHQKLLGKIFSKVLTFVESNNLGEVRVSPYDVYLDEQNIFQPDIFFIAKENAHKIKNYLYGAPDLVIEILSPRTARFDKVDKRQVYEKFGVKEYFMIDPDERTVISYLLVNDKFEELPATTGVIESKLLGTTF